METYYVMKDHLKANADPVTAMHPATKQYIDNKALNVDGARFTSGTIAVSKLPAFSGQVTTQAGGNVLTLGDVVTPGVYNSFNINNRGRVVGASYIDTDTNNLSWTIVKDKSTTLAGFDITDVVKTGGDTVAAIQTSDTQSSDSKATITKSTVDTAVGQVQFAQVQTGEVVRLPTPTTPAGYLRANGGLVDKTAYAALYAILGEVYKKSTVDTFGYIGYPWQQQSLFNTSNTSSTLTWSAETALSAGTYSYQSVVTKNRVYLFSGLGADTVRRTYTAPINTDGTLGAWVVTTNTFPAQLQYSASFATKNRVYVIGGMNGFTNTKTVYTAPINADGTLGTWTTATNFPTDVFGHSAFVTKNRVYVVGGDTGVFMTNTNYHKTIYTAPINEDGTIGTWTTAGSMLNSFLTNQVVVTPKRVYLLGSVASDGTATTPTQSAPINADGTLGSWVAGTALPTNFRLGTVVSNSTRVWLLGGYTASSINKTVYTAPINTDGTLGAWATAGSLLYGCAMGSAFITSSRIYLAGGVVGASSVSANVQSASFAGGFNDYLTLAASGGVDPNSFYLPDYTSKETDKLYYYVKS
jgi:microcystin-dependent protein